MKLKTIEDFCKGVVKDGMILGVAFWAFSQPNMDSSKQSLRSCAYTAGAISATALAGWYVTNIYRERKERSYSSNIKTK